MIELTKRKKPEILLKYEKEWKRELLEEDNPKEYLKRRYNHKEIKETLKKETKGKCAYCESKILHIAFGHIEHIFPQSKFIEKTFEWGNLTLACELCNINKKDYYDEKYSILNPYVDLMQDHILISGILILAKTKRGEITICKLDLNRIELIERRRNAILNINRLYVMYNEESHPVIKDMFYKEIKNQLNDESEFLGTLKALEKNSYVI